MMHESTFGIPDYNMSALNHEVLPRILHSVEAIQIGRGAEIGVLYGDTSFSLLRDLPTLILFSVDPYLPYDEPDRTAQHLAHYENLARQKLSVFGPRSVMVKATSVDAAPTIPNESLDFVFIDAQHTYEACKEDIETWFPKIRRGGFVTGHDYRWDGVTRAVNEFVQAKGYQGYFTPGASDLWLFQKT